MVKGVKMQAVLILAHGNNEQLVALCKKLCECFYVYVHYDAKNYPKVPDSTKQELKSIPNVFVYSKFIVHWGAFSIIDATMFLIAEALKKVEIKYFHLISGQDWIVKDVKDIYNYFDENPHIYMPFALASSLTKKHENVLLWQKLYYPYDIINRRSLFGKIFHRVSMCLQILLNVNKLRKYNINYDIYSGSQWWSMPREAIEYVNSVYLRQDPIVKVMKTGFCSDEMFFQTILCNSKTFANCIINDNLRYIIKKFKNGSWPAILDHEDYDDIIQRKVFFMRKISLNVSKHLLERLNQV